MPSVAYKIFDQRSDLSIWNGVLERLLCVYESYMALAGALGIDIIHGVVTQKDCYLNVTALY